MNSFRQIRLRPRAMADWSRALASDLKAIDTRGTRVVLLEDAPRVLCVYPEELSCKAE